MIKFKKTLPFSFTMLSVSIIRDVIISEVGDDALKLVEHLKKHKESSDFSLAEALGEDINSVRNKLYRLQQQNLIGFTKRKDEEKGWYVYFWFLKPDSFRYAYKKMLETKLRKVEEAINRKSSESLYQCSEGCTRLSSDEALSRNYVCPDCGNLVEPLDNSKEILKLKSQKNKLMKSMEKLV